MYSDYLLTDSGNIGKTWIGNLKRAAREKSIYSLSAKHYSQRKGRYKFP
jgi:hypothetical protein